MAQFDLYNVDGIIVVDLQSDIIGLDLTRLVAPLQRAGSHEFLPKLTPKATWDGNDYVVHIHDLATLTRSELGEPVGNLSHLADDLLRAVDILTRGF